MTDKLQPCRQCGAFHEGDCHIVHEVAPRNVISARLEVLLDAEWSRATFILCPALCPPGRTEGYYHDASARARQSLGDAIDAAIAEAKHAASKDTGPDKTAWLIEGSMQADGTRANGVPIDERTPCYWAGSYWADNVDDAAHFDSESAAKLAFEVTNFAGFMRARIQEHMWAPIRGASSPRSPSAQAVNAAKHSYCSESPFCGMHVAIERAVVAAYAVDFPGIA